MYTARLSVELMLVTTVSQLLANLVAIAGLSVYVYNIQYCHTHTQTQHSVLAAFCISYSH